ncbi:MAG: hypothetical protein HQ555_11795 [Candidatus Aminicenantes bacterium]|nr:hypothetical protein [Candidatus Aminicenantes bacterium]
MFSVKYLNMCKAGMDIIRCFRTSEFFNEAEGGIVLPVSIFKAGDYFHHPRMQEGEIKIVKEVKGFISVHSTDSESYSEEECIWIPTAEQIKKGLLEIHWSIGDVSGEGDPERLMIRFMDSRGKKWNRIGNIWVDIKEKK